MSVALVSSFFIYHMCVYNGNFTFVATKRVWIFDGILVFDVIHVYIPCKGIHT